MGLIKAIGGAIGGVLADQWKEYFYAEALDADTLIEKGYKRTGARSSNTKGSDNIISNGSVVAVNEGQFMLIVDQGKIVEFSAEAGEFLYDASTEPSLFFGGFGKGLLESFKNVGKRFTFGGEPGKDQRVYYLNKKEIVGNKYGTSNPIPFRVVDKNIGLDIDVSIRCFGEYSYKITDPLIFFSNVAGNVTKSYRRDAIDSQLKSELMTALQPAFARISAMGIRYSALPGHTKEIADALNDELSEQWGKLRGLAVASFGVSSVTAPKEDEDLIKQLQKAGALRSPDLAAATLVGAQADAMRMAAQNQGAGPFMAFAGMNMAANAGGMNSAQLFQMAQQQGASAQAQQPAAPQAPAAPAGWTCTCGVAGNEGKFCSECGAKRPVGVKPLKCDKCGWQPKDGDKLPKFCPECGDVFDENDGK